MMRNNEEGREEGTHEIREGLNGKEELLLLMVFNTNSLSPMGEIYTEQWNRRGVAESRAQWMRGADR